MSKFVLTLDSTQLQAFSECPQMWQLAYREHLVRAGAEEKEAMNAGTYGHAMLDIYYKGRAAGFSLDDSIDLANCFDPDKQTCECGHPLKEHGDYLTDDWECVTGCECDLWRPKPYPLNQDLRYLVRGRVRDHIFKYRNNDIVPISPDSVEVGFSEPIYEDDDNLFVLEGRIDVLGTIQGINLVLDHKFQMRKRDLYRKSIQFRNYNLVSGVQTLMINYIRLTKKVDETTFVRSVASFQPAETRWWQGELIKYFFAIKKELRNCDVDQQILRQEWGACSGKFGYPCSYTDLCEHTDSSLIQIIKDTQYTKKEEWKPW